MHSASCFSGGISFTKNHHLPSEEPSPRLAVLTPCELRKAVPPLEANPEVIWKAHLIVTGTAHEIGPANASPPAKHRDGSVCGEVIV